MAGQSLSASSVRLAVNSTGAAVKEAFSTDADTVLIDVPAGPFVRVAAEGVDLAVDGQTLHGNFAFEQGTTGDGDQVVKVALANVEAGLSDASGELISVTGGQGLFVLTAGGVAGDANAAVSVAERTGIALAGQFSLAVNTTSLPVDDEIAVGSNGTTVALYLPEGFFFAVRASGARLTAGGSSSRPRVSSSRSNPRRPARQRWGLPGLPSSAASSASSGRPPVPTRC